MTDNTLNAKIILASSLRWPFSFSFYALPFVASLGCNVRFVAAAAEVASLAAVSILLILISLRIVSFRFSSSFFLLIHFFLFSYVFSFVRLHLHSLNLLCAIRIDLTHLVRLYSEANFLYGVTLNYIFSSSLFFYYVFRNKY